MFCPQWPTGQGYFYFFPWMWISIAMIRNIATDAATVGRRYRHLLQWHSFCLLLHCHADLIAQGKVSSTKRFLLGSIWGWHTCPYGPNIAWSASCLWVRGEYTIYCDQISAEKKERPNAKQLHFFNYLSNEGQICTSVILIQYMGRKMLPFISVAFWDVARPWDVLMCVICVVTGAEANLVLLIITTRDRTECS